MKELRQVQYHYAIGPHVRPIMTIRPGETVNVETLDNVGNQVTSENDGNKIHSPLNPLSGPIFVEGAERGDCLEIKIGDIEILRGQGWTGQTSEWGFVEMTSPLWSVLPKTIPTLIKICKIGQGTVYFPLDNGKKVELPLRPLIGTIGTAPDVEVPSGTPGPHGGNMDCCEVRPTNKLFLPVYVKGALLYVGDVHASQGDGELGGAPVEVSARSTLTIDLIKNKTIGWPRIESKDHIMTVGSSKPLESAIRAALAEMVTWLMTEYHLSIWDINLLLTAAAEIQCSQITNPLYTAALKFQKKYLP
jgi:amidase